jgi:hypothetical protein
MYKARINGVVHEVTVHPDGGITYDPPLSKDRVKKEKANGDAMRKAGVAPGTRTDTGWHAGRGTLLDQMDGDEVWTKHLVSEARKQGYNPGANDVYIGQLADRTGDKNAWFKPSDGRAELKKRLKAAGKGCDIPGLKVEPRPYQEKKGKLLNPRIVKQLERQYVASGEASGKTQQELRSHIIETHGRAL